MPCALGELTRLRLGMIFGMAVPNSFLKYFSDVAPGLRVQLNYPEEAPMTVPVEHSLGPEPGSDGRAFLKSLGHLGRLSEFWSFYKSHDGFQLCRTNDSRFGEVQALLEVVPSGAIRNFSAQYYPGGKLDWTIDHNKSRKIYRGADAWLAFARINGGPSCLTIFLEGRSAGEIFYLTPQPAFNILRPIAPSFEQLLRRIGYDIAAFLRLVRATVTLRAADGDNYGFVPLEYVSDQGR
jgi:hypothetical protein